MAEGLHVDVEPSGRSDGFGDVIVTDLLNRAMPLIRYRIGDVAALSPASRCRCGRALPRLSRVEGRVWQPPYNGRSGQADSLLNTNANVVLR